MKSGRIRRYLATSCCIAMISGEVFLGETLKSVASDDQARRSQVKKRGLQVVNEHFELDFNATECSSFSAFSEGALIALGNYESVGKNPVLLHTIQT